MDRDQPLSPSVDRALSVLELLVDYPDGLSISEISRLSQQAKSSLFNILQTMHARGFLVKDAVTKRYSLGSRVLVLGTAYSRHNNLIVEFMRVARSLATKTGETVQLGVLQGSDVLYLGKQEGTQPVRLASEVGVQIPAHATALGKCLLSGLSDGELDQFFDGIKLEKITEQTIDNILELRSEIANVRVQGYAEDRGETLVDVQCIGAPIFDAHGVVAAAVSISIPIARLDDRRKEVLIQDVKAVALELSTQLGYDTRRIGRYKEPMVVSEADIPQSLAVP